MNVFFMTHPKLLYQAFPKLQIVFHFILLYNMIMPEKHGPRINEPVLPKETTELIHGQAKVIREMITRWNLDGIGVLSQPQKRDAEFFKNRKTLVSTSLDNTSLVLATANTGHDPQSTEIPLSVLIATPKGAEESGLLKDGSGTIYTDSFWMFEDGVFKYIVPSEPIVADGLVTSGDMKREDTSWSEINEPLNHLSNNKDLAKDVLIEAGVPVPEGVLLGRDDDLDEGIDTLLASYPDREWFVIKALHGAHGDGIYIIRRDHQAITARLATGISADREPRLVEERITPPPLATLMRPDDPNLSLFSNPDIDYNFRIFTTLDQSDPRVIDGLIRYIQQDPNNPISVNLSHIDVPAAEQKVDILRDDIKEAIYQIAINATKAICQKTDYSLDKDFRVAGVDIIIDSDGTIKVMEIGTDGIGAFEHIVMLDRKPLGSIKDILFPAWSSQLETNFHQRGTSNPEELTRLQTNGTDYELLTESYFALKNYTRAEDLIIANPENANDPELVVAMLQRIAIEGSGNFDRLEAYLLEQVGADPDNTALQGIYLDIMRTKILLSGNKL